jgi:NhaP-type Na+/H+ or K+/H+ antiporter
MPHLEPAAIFAIIGFLGIGSQWLAWRLQLPAIVLMLVAGILAGPVLGVLHPEQDLGHLLRPIVSVAVAVILFEGGLTLKFKELSDAAPAVRRLVYFGAPLGWLLSTLAIHYGAGLSWESSAVFGGILVVTGPTVVTPLLRQARLSQRPASILRWEAIVNDPVGAIFAVLAFEVVTTLHGAGSIAAAIQHLAIGIIVAAVAGYIGGLLIVKSFRRGWVPEYMKVPVLFGVLLAVYAATDGVLHESGLLAVTVMGVYIGNAHLPSLDELKRFKEHITVILVSGVFILLAASLKFETLAQLDWRAAVFVGAIVLLVRPVTILVSLIGTELNWREKSIIAWIGPRGVVAVAVSGLFGVRLVELGVEDGALLAPLAFALVAATVILHGFSMRPMARALGLTSTKPAGLIIIGASSWSTAFAAKVMSEGFPVIMADRNYLRLREARLLEIPVFHGEILSEAAEHTIDLNLYGTLLAATDNDAYNALICTDFGPEFGRQNVYQVGRAEAGEGNKDLPPTLGGRSFGSGLKFHDLLKKMQTGWQFRSTNLTPEYDYDAYLAKRPQSEVLGFITEKRELIINSENDEPTKRTAGEVLALVKDESP